jgi:hypothetical protein
VLYCSPKSLCLLVTPEQHMTNDVIIDIELIYTTKCKKRLTWSDNNGGTLELVHPIPARQSQNTRKRRPPPQKPPSRRPPPPKSPPPPPPPSTPKSRFAQVRDMLHDLERSIDALKKSSDAKYGPSILHSTKPIAQLVIPDPVECTVYECTEIGYIKHPAFAGSMCAKHAEAAAVDMMFRCAADFCNEVLPCSTRTHKQVNLPCRSRPCSRNRRRIQKQPNSVIRFCGDHEALQHLHRQCRYHPYRIKAPGKSTCTQCVQEGRVTAI